MKSRYRGKNNTYLLKSRIILLQIKKIYYKHPTVIGKGVRGFHSVSLIIGRPRDGRQFSLLYDVLT